MNSKLNDESFLKLIEDAPLASIDLIVQTTAGKVLLGFRKNAPARDTWFVPGGRIRKWETIEDAFHRIAHDELKLTKSLSDAEFLGVPFQHRYANEEKCGKQGVAIHYVVLPFVVRVPNEFQLSEDEQHKEYKWFEVNELLRNKSVHSNTKEFLTCPLKIPNDPGVYRALVSQYIHYDRQFWSRTQMLLAVQGAVLVGGYNLRSVWVGPAIMIGGFIITLIIGGLIDRDIENSRVNESMMDRLANKIFDYYGPTRVLNLRSEPRLVGGRSLIWWVVAGLAILNLWLAFLYATHSSMLPPEPAMGVEKLEGEVETLSTTLKSIGEDLHGNSELLRRHIVRQRQIEKTIEAMKHD